MIAIDTIREAAERIAPYIHRTPVHTCRTLDGWAGKRLYLKCELFQVTGSFKYRGATNAVQKLDATAAARGVITHSSGNHGQALARAAQVRGIPCTVVMPHTASAIKKTAVRGYGAAIVESGPSSPEREAVAAAEQAKTGATLIPPFDHEDVIAGQGTAALELLEAVPHLDSLIVPVGGGGMIAGFSVAAHGIKPDLHIIGAEPAGGGDARESLLKGERVKWPTTASLADGLLTNYLGDLTWPIVQQHVRAIEVVSEAEIIAAMRLVWERMKLLIEPSAAVGVAVALSDAVRAQPHEHVGIVLCGGNVRLDALPW
jgi:threonine dehydratase